MASFNRGGGQMNSSCRMLVIYNVALAMFVLLAMYAATILY